MDSESYTSALDWMEEDTSPKPYLLKSWKGIFNMIVIVCLLFTSGIYHYHFMLDVESLQRCLPNVSVDTSGVGLGHHNTNLSFIDWIESHRTEASLLDWQDAWGTFRSQMMVRYPLPKLYAICLFTPKYLSGLRAHHPFLSL
jgi:hypothetical protein